MARHRIRQSDARLCLRRRANGPPRAAPSKLHSGKKSGRPEQWLTDERAQAIRRLTQAGATAAGIAIRLGISERTVTWHRARLRRRQETSGASLPTVPETS